MSESAEQFAMHKRFITTRVDVSRRLAPGRTRELLWDEIHVTHVGHFRTEPHTPRPPHREVATRDPSHRPTDPSARCLRVRAQSGHPLPFRGPWPHGPQLGNASWREKGG